MPASAPLFNKRIFWDVDYTVIDYDKSAAFVIERVFVRGDVPDIRECRAYYCDDKVREVLTHARWLPLTTIYLACAICENELTDYLCCNTAQLNPEHWMC